MIKIDIDSFLLYCYAYECEAIQYECPKSGNEYYETWQNIFNAIGRDKLLSEITKKLRVVDIWDPDFKGILFNSPQDKLAFLLKVG